VSGFYPDDPNDAIPRVGVIDLISEEENGDLLCGLIIARPLGSNRNSLGRLVQKAENYIRELGQVAREHRVRVDVVVHPQTEPAALKVIEECCDWMRENAILCTVSTLRSTESDS